jgi:DNA-binding LacI/PurR family transcriptional regulator
MAVTHLIERGHRRIAIITGPPTLKNEQERLRGYHQALQKAGLPIEDSLIWRASFDHAEVESLTRSGLADPQDRPTALFATNGVTGIAAVKSIYAMGMATPRDIAIITFDELTSEDFFRPAISSVVQPAFEIGSRAVEVLLGRIRAAEAHPAVEKIRLPATLIVRESSASPASSLPRP